MVSESGSVNMDPNLGELYQSESGSLLGSMQNIEGGDRCKGHNEIFGTEVSCRRVGHR
jgi:hypothetical protein